MAFKNFVVIAGLMSGFFAGSTQKESFIEEVPCKNNKNKKRSDKQNKEYLAEELKELARDINYEMHELLKSQEFLIDRLDELVNNDKNGVFSGASSQSLAELTTKVDALRAAAAERRKQQREQNQVLKHGSAQ